MTKSPKRNILVPVDFTSQSLLAIDHSQKLARHIGAEITLLNIIDQGKNISEKAAGIETTKDLESKLREFALGSNVGRYKTIICKGAIPFQIIENAKTINANFIVMGAHKEKYQKKSNRHASNTLQVIKESATPVITINGNLLKEKFENIILPLDLSNVTTQKVSKAIEIAKLGKGTTIKLLSVVFSIDDFIINRLTKQMQQVKTTIKESGVQCTAEIVKANKDEETLGEVILDYTRREDGDLIVIMTKQDKDSKRKIVDEDAEEIITSSDIPVLSIIPSR